MRKIKNTYPAVAAHMPGLSTWRAMPTPHVQWLDPFLFINHHGPDIFRPGNRGLPFGPHPHRGFETLTYILEGELIHQDTTGYKSRILEGGVQWMTAGSGLLHSETSSQEFREEGGAMELIQLWLNLPSKLKMTPPKYVGLQKGELVHFSPQEGVTVHLISGEILGKQGPIDSITDLTMTWIDISAEATLKLEVPEDEQILFYVVNGDGHVNGSSFGKRTLVEFQHDGESVEILTETDTRILFGHGKPFNEPIAAQGPFVMNTQQELHQAIIDYQEGKMGIWEE